MAKVKYDPVGNLIRLLARESVQWVRQHPYLSASIVVHLILLYALFSFGTYQFKQQALKQEQVNIESSIKRYEEMQRKEMRRHVDNLEKMKQLLDQSAGEDPEEKSTQESPDQSTQKKYLNTADLEAPNDLLKKAKDLSQAIKRIEKKIKAEDMSKILNMSKEEAMKKIEAEEARAQAEQKNKNQNSSSAQQDLAKTNEEIKQLEDQARKTLEKRKAQLDTANNGFKIKPVSAETNPDQQSENTLSKTKSKNLTKGEGSGAGVGLASAGSAEPPSKRIQEFLSKAAYQSSWSFSESDISRIPFAEETYYKDTGRIFGAGGEFAERIYLNTWYLIGPFQGNAGVKLFENPSYPPEEFVDLDAVYIGKEDRILKWEYMSQHNYPFTPTDATTDSVYYGYNEIKFEQAADVFMWFGADDDLQVWIDNQLVWRGGNINKQALYDIAYNSGDQYWKTWNLSDGKIPLHFEKGVHRVLFKLSNGPNPKGVFASLVMTKN